MVASPVLVGGSEWSTETDPESAGLVRRERPGVALAFVLVGVIAAVASFFLDWVRVTLWDAEGPWFNFMEWSGPGGVVDLTREAAGPDAGGGIASAFFPILAVALTALVCLSAVVAAVGLRRRSRTDTVRVLTVVLAVVAVALAVWALFDLGFRVGASEAASTSVGTELSPTTAPDDLEVLPWFGLLLWAAAMGCLAVAGALGPRVGHVLPDGGAASLTGAVPGGVGAIGGMPAGTVGGMPAGALVRRAPQVTAVVLAAVGAVAALLGYGFLSWAASGDTVTFAEIGEAVREHGAGDDVVLEAYFGWLGWVVLAILVALPILLATARSPRARSGPAIRGTFAGFVAVSVGLHGYVIVKALEGSLGIAPILVAVGLALALLATMLPLRAWVRIRQVAAPAHVWQGGQG